MAQWPSNGYRLLKGKGSRLVREIYGDGDVDDWTNGQFREGLTGWEKGLIFADSGTKFGTSLWSRWSRGSSPVARAS